MSHAVMAGVDHGAQMAHAAAQDSSSMGHGFAGCFAMVVTAVMACCVAARSSAKAGRDIRTPRLEPYELAAPFKPPDLLALGVQLI
jgi:hypothetical protein